MIHPEAVKEHNDESKIYSGPRISNNFLDYFKIRKLEVNLRRSDVSSELNAISLHKLC